MCGCTAHHFDNFSQLIRPAERVMLVSIYYSICCLTPLYYVDFLSTILPPPLSFYYLYLSAWHLFCTPRDQAD